MNEKTAKQKITKGFKEDAIKLVLEHGYKLSEVGDVLKCTPLTYPDGSANPKKHRKILLMAVSQSVSWKPKIVV
jgi:hypothetical protein